MVKPLPVDDRSEASQAAVRRRAARVLSGWAVLATAALVYETFRSGVALIDLRVYLVGGQAWWEGVALYAPGFPAPLAGPPLPFTYPPLAAALFSVLDVVPWTALVALWTAAGIAVLTWVCVLVARRVHPAPHATLIGFGVAGAALLAEPVRATLDFGQVNLLLLALVVTDCLVVRPRWPRGVLIGLAAAIKLTPLIFLVYFLVRGDRRGAATMAASFIGFGLLGYVAAPADSLRYWFEVLGDPSRVGGLAYAGNQSLRGLLHRLDLGPGPEQIAWVTLGLAVVALTVLAARTAAARGQDVLSMLVVATAALLLSPVSWSHHWVWVAPAAVLALRTHITLAAALALVFPAGAHELLPAADDRELAWTWWQHLIGNAYVWSGLALLVFTAFATRRSPDGELFRLPEDPGYHRDHDHSGVQRPIRR